jgi:hypothetical protein
MLATPRNARLLHTIVAMGVALTSGAVGTACGGATLESPAAVDGGGKGDGDSPDAYPTIGYHAQDGDIVQGADAYPIIYPAPPRDAGADADAYPTIGIYQPDGAVDAYPTIEPAVDAAIDGYPIIVPVYDAGSDAYAIILPPGPGAH